MKKQVTIYTDGASRGNPGKGGWGAILMTEKEAIELAGRKDNATNNQMELEGAIQGLTVALKKFKGYTVVFHSDSAYVLGGLNGWLDGWERNGWMTSTKKPVENKAQWQKLMKLRDELGIDLHLVKVAGHSGHEFNDRCDELAVGAALGKKQILFKGTYTAYLGYLAENPPSSPVKKSPSKKSSSSEKPYSYVSCVGGIVYADKSWSACEARVKGKKGAKFKKVFSKAEETELMQDYTLASLL
jgi:ribonuclease HI